MEKQESEAALLRRETFPGARFKKSILTQAGKVLKNQGSAAYLDFLREALEKQGTTNPPNAQPPVKCLIVAQSRDFSEWDVSKTSAGIQAYIYGLTEEEFRGQDPRKRTSKDSHTEWLKHSKVQVPFRGVQGLNLIFKASAQRYEGVLTKVGNRNKKKLKGYEEKCLLAKERGEEPPDRPETEYAFDETGRLREKPGINPNIYICQNSTTPYKGDKQLPPEYEGYAHDPSKPIPRGTPVDRTTIPKGSPGYVPTYQWENLSTNKHKRMRKGWGPSSTATRAKALGALLVTLSIGDDWVVVDARGLLRNAYWRRLMPKEGTLRDLLGLFTDYPVIDPRARKAVFLYREGLVPVWTKKPYSYRQAPKLITKLISEEKSVALVSIDLGQTNPISARVSRTTGECLDTFFLPEELIRDVTKLRAAHDAFNQKCHLEAVSLLDPKYQQEFESQGPQAPLQTRQAICAALNLNEAELPWGAMSQSSLHISDAFLERGGDPERAHFVGTPKKGAPTGETLLRRDGKWANEFKPKVSQEGRKAYQEVLWEIQRTSEDYRRLSQRKLELTRRGVNYVLARAKKRTQCDVLVVVIEDLNVRIMNGKG